MGYEEQLFILAKIGLAAVLAGAVGLEREMARKPAGCRTHMLLAASACLLVAVASAFIQETAHDTGPALRPDPLRIIEAIVAGVAFLGAGTIIRSQDPGEVEGLTTAGSLLLVAAIGVTVALELFLLAVLTTLLSLLILRSLNRFERFAARRWKKRKERRE